MASSFSVTTASSKILLNAQRRGEIVFTVTNITAGTVTGRADTASDNASVEAWATIQGKSERDFAPNATEQFVVAIDVPGSAAIGTYSISLNLIGVDDPDEDFTEGPSVAFEVPEPVVAPPKRKFNFSWWWLVAVVVAFLVLEGLIIFTGLKAAENSGGFMLFAFGLLSSLVMGAAILFTFGSIVVLKDAIMRLVRGSAEPSSATYPWWWIGAIGVGGLFSGMIVAGILSATFRTAGGILVGTGIVLVIILFEVLLTSIPMILILRYFQSLQETVLENVRWLWVAISGAGTFLLGAIFGLITDVVEGDLLYQIVYFGEIILLPIILIAAIIVYILMRRRLPIPEVAELSLVDFFMGTVPTERS